MDAQSGQELNHMNSQVYTEITTGTIPQLGFGVYKSHGQKCIDAMIAAIKAGYRHIDTAEFYDNEKEVGEVIKYFANSNPPVTRQELFITTKILSPGGSLTKSYQKCLKSIEIIDGADGYVDLFLIHSPNCGYVARQEMYGALEMLLDEGRVRLIGVSNWGIGHIEELRSYACIWPPHVNQIELHPFCQQREVVEYCRQRHILIEAYCPLVRNQRNKDPVLNDIARDHHKSVAQILIRWSLQKQWIPLPKSDNPRRIRENADVWNFQLTEDEMSRIDNLDEGDRGAIVQVVQNDL